MNPPPTYVDFTRRKMALLNPRPHARRWAWCILLALAVGGAALWWAS